MPSLLTYRHLTKLNEFYVRPGWRRRWGAEIERRAEGLEVVVDAQSFCRHTNPLFGTDHCLRFLIERYRPGLDLLDRIGPVGSILEIGSAQGVTSYFMTDLAPVTGIDILPNRTKVASHLFPEAKFICGDVFEYLQSEKPHFDIIVQSDGPAGPKDAAPYCRLFMDIGRPTWTAFAGPRLAVSYRCTVFGEGMSGISWRYPRYYFRTQYLRDWKSLLTLHRSWKDVPV